MRVLSAEAIEISDESHIVLARVRAAQAAKKMGMKILDQTKIATATSELARNIVRYATSGEVSIQEVEDGGRAGLRLVFNDKGPGIRDVPRAMEDGFTTGKGMGLGLSGARRLVNEFEIHSEVGVGTTVIITKWKHN